MRILFDHGMPSGMATRLPGHEVREAIDYGWEALPKSELLAKAEKAGFEVLLTNDRQIRPERSLRGRRIAIVLIADPKRPKMAQIAKTVGEATPGSYTEVGAKF